MRGTFTGLPAGSGNLLVADVANLDAWTIGHWRGLYERFGTRIQQSYEYAWAVRQSVEPLLVVVGTDMVSAFVFENAALTCLSQDMPLLGTDTSAARLAAVMSAVHRSTDRPVYAPLVGVEYSRLRATPGFLTWDRLPNSLIDWSGDGMSRWERDMRSSSQIKRKGRIIHRDGLALQVAQAGEDAVRTMLAVDDSSWKATCGQSMHQRMPQAKIYGELLRSGMLTATFLAADDQAIAFRLDSRVGDRVTCLKWSYDTSFKRYSPGTYLLTEGLLRQWRGEGIATVDLYGSPDPLKEMIHTMRQERIDVWYGDCALGARRARDRRDLDMRVMQAFRQGKGSRHVFEAS